MKRTWTVAGIAAIAAIAMMGFAGAAFADSSGTSAHPCRQLKMQVVQACKGAGFIKGQAKTGNGLWKDCVRPVMHGQTVKGVSANSQLMQACQAKRAAHHPGGAGTAPGNS